MQELNLQYKVGDTVQVGVYAGPSGYMFAEGIVKKIDMLFMKGGIANHMGYELSVETAPGEYYTQFIPMVIPQGQDGT